MVAEAEHASQEEERLACQAATESMEEQGDGANAWNVRGTAHQQES